MKKIVCILIVYCSCIIAFGQSSNDILEMLIEKEMITPEEAESLREKCKKKENPTIQKIKTAFLNSDVFRLNGYGQIVFNTTDHTPSGVPNTNMRVNRAILFATGNLNRNLAYMIMYDFGSNSQLLELYGDYTPVRAASIRFGQFKVPFTIENPMSPTRWEGIYGSLSVNALAGASTDVIGAKSGRDMGLQLSGKLLPKDNFNSIEYYAGLFNGTGVNTPDNNNHKDFAGTLMYQPIKDLKLAGSIYSGEARYAINSTEPARNRVRNRWSAGAEYDSKHMYARAEYLYGNDGGIDRYGYYGVGIWKVIPLKLDIFGKYDYYNPDKSTHSVEKTQITGGVNYYLGFLSRIQLNYIHTNDKAFGGDINTLAAQLQLFF